jgi:hypothetical protein
MAIRFRGEGVTTQDIGNILTDAQTLVDLGKPGPGLPSGSWFTMLVRCTNFGGLGSFPVPVQPNKVILHFFWTDVTAFTVLSRNASTASSLSIGASPTWYGRDQQIILCQLGATSASIPLLPLGEVIEKPEKIYVNSAGTSGNMIFTFEDISEDTAPT